MTLKGEERKTMVRRETMAWEEPQRNVKKRVEKGEDGVFGLSSGRDTNAASIHRPKAGETE
jgi:hypothetical protein